MSEADLCKAYRRTAAWYGLHARGDFMALLALHPEDWQIALDVIAEMQRMVQQQGGV